MMNDKDDEMDSMSSTRLLSDSQKLSNNNGIPDIPLCGFLSIRFYQPYFDVDTNTVLSRLWNTLFFFKNKDNFLSEIDDKPDAYGPFWISTTLVFAIAVASQINSWLYSWVNNKSWHYNFQKVLTASTVIYGCALGIPFLIWFAFRQLNANCKLSSIICVYGYSLFFFLLFSVLCLWPSSLMLWGSLTGATALSILFLLRNIGPVIVESAPTMMVPFVVVLSVQYNFQVISIVLLMMSVSECTSSEDSCKDGEQAAWVKGTATATVFAGAIAGQLCMGYAGDILGRDVAMTFTLALASVAALCSSLFPMGSPSSVYSIIIVFRFILGVGLGGVYPLSATKAAEDAGDGHAGTAASWAFFWQNPGAMGPWLLAYFFTYSSMSVNIKWRLLLGLGFIPGIVVVWGSIIEHRNKKANQLSSKGMDVSLLESSEKSDSLNLSKALMDWRFQKMLLSTGGGWFIYDVCYYGVNLFGGDIVKAIDSGSNDDVSSNSSIRDITGKELIALSMAIPACLLTIYLLKPVGTRMLQCYGFIFIGTCFVLMASTFATLRDSNPKLLYALYCLLLFSLSFGPNVTTFILPAETYPKEIRATFNGISAACGKLGAVVGAYMFGPLVMSTSLMFVMWFCGILAFIGAIAAFFFIEKPDQSINLSEFTTLDSEEHEEVFNVVA